MYDSVRVEQHYESSFRSSMSMPRTVNDYDDVSSISNTHYFVPGTPNPHTQQQQPQQQDDTDHYFVPSQVEQQDHYSDASFRH